MNTNLIWKSVFLSAALIVSAVVLYPNALWYSMPIEQRQEQARRKNPLAQKVIPLGLDLQGGVHLVYQVDLSKLPDVSDQTVTTAINQNITVINNRIDALGVANALVVRQGREFILVQLPGVYGSEDAKKIIGKTALLEFRMVKNDDALVKIVEAIEKEKLLPDDILSKGLPADIKKLVPSGMELLPVKEGGYLLTNATPDLTGKYLKQARVDQGSGNGLQIQGVAVEFELNTEGANLFEALTGSHIGDRLAIVLDGIIQSAPTIQSRIRNNGQITGVGSDNEAKLIANILNSGNLQAAMKVVEERTVGPELGEDSIKAGLNAVLFGFIFILVFMIFNYRVSGFLADLALIINLFVLMAVMAGLKATLTLPGIAGTILSLAMAVDANVLILERIREELAKGKQPRFAIEEGYNKAFSAIFDGNLTTIIPGIFLFQFGSGPVKGFAVTLIAGLIISMITAIAVTKIFYEIWFEMAHPKTLSV
jgi:preprotein translocase subunit SecD